MAESGLGVVRCEHALQALNVHVWFIMVQLTPRS